MYKLVCRNNIENHSELEHFIDDLPLAFNKEGITLHDERNIIKSFTLDNDFIVVKRFKKPNLFQRIAYTFFRPSKMVRALWNANKLQQLGIDTPYVFAMIEIKNRVLLTDGFLLTAFCDKIPLEQALGHSGDFDHDIAKEFARFMARLHELGIVHGDLNSTNVRFKKEADKCMFSLIDINRMKILPSSKKLSIEECLTNFTQFTANYKLLEFVITCYAEERKWNVESTVSRGLRIKIKHDKRWSRRKKFTRLFKKLLKV